MTTFTTSLSANGASWTFEAKLAGSEMMARVTTDTNGDEGFTHITSGKDAKLDLPDGTETTLRAKYMGGKWFLNFFGGSLDADSRRVNINLPSAEAA